MSTETYLLIVTISAAFALTIGASVGVSVGNRLARQHRPPDECLTWSLIAGCASYLGTIGVTVILTTILTTI